MISDIDRFSERHGGHAYIPPWQMANFDNATVVACGSGRLRIAVPRLYRSHRLKTAIERELGRRPGIVAVYASTLGARQTLPA